MTLRKRCSPIPTRLELALALVALLVAPFFLKRRSRLVRRIIIRGRPSEIFPYLNDLRNWPRWTKWGRDEEAHYSYSGPETGARSEQKWRTRRMRGETRLLQSVPDEQVAYHANIQDGRFHSDGILTLEPVGDVTRVTWLVRWDVGPNVYARYKSLFIKWFAGRDFQAGLTNLKELIESGGL
jgi:hypothetical protein